MVWLVKKRTDVSEYMIQGVIVVTKMKNPKILCGIAAGLILLVIAAAVFFRLGGREESYRDLSVFELSGELTVLRDDTSLNAYEGMKLENGDFLQMSGKAMRDFC